MQKAYPDQENYHASRLFKLLHGYLCGPITPATPAGNRYMFLIVDDLSRYMWCFLMKTKYQVFEVFKRFKDGVETDREESLPWQNLMNDEMRQFTIINVEFQKLLEEEIAQANGSGTNTGSSPVNTTNIEQMEEGGSAFETNVGGPSITNMGGSGSGPDGDNSNPLVNQENEETAQIEHPIRRSTRAKIIPSKLKDFVIHDGVNRGDQTSVLISTDDEPSNYSQAKGNKFWEKAIQKVLFEQEWKQKRTDYQRLCMAFDRHQGLGTEAYAKKLLKEVGLLECNHVKCPMDPGVKISKDEQGKPEDATSFRRIIGSDRLCLQPIVIKVDNKWAIALMKKPVFHGRSKHIDTRYHFIRECVEAGKVEIEFINGNEYKADILTKPLGRNKFEEMRELMGMEDLLIPSRELRG
ncbi:hypothetical protein E3N88_09696 [Mikania micrantha]|uniref:Reverse transcriptase Ty1/copia-type domain-containing protein n=1 Tax=Mikania micrantha TaxID=192012 RepID=A0A5N6PJS9_9ASTR|nr:hypothetical protein E3N88_09696 [Mikania micrantha]